MTEADTSSIPTLTDVLVPGKPVPARSPASAAPQPPASAAIPVLTDVVAPHAAGAAPADSRQSELDRDSVVVECVPTPHVPAVELPGDAATAAAAAMGETDAPAEPGAAEHVVAEDNDPVLRVVRTAAREHGVWVQLGSLAVRGPGGRLANRAFVIDDAGTIRAR